jgi:hypothetical protein
VAQCLLKFSKSGFLAIGVPFTPYAPFVDDGARPGVDHFVAEDGCLVVEGSGGTNVAASLGEKDGDVVL